MQATTADFKKSLTGSTKRVIRVDAHHPKLGLLAQGLPVASGSVTVTAGQAIRTRATITISDPDGKYTPRRENDPLYVSGQELHVFGGLQLGNRTELLSIGWLPIVQASTDEQWVSYTRRGETDLKWVSRGQTTSVECTDRATLVGRSKFMARQQPTQSTVLAEVAALLRGVVPWNGAVGSVVDRSLPTDLKYEEDRLGAIGKILDSVDADLIADANGLMVARARAAGASVWDLTIGDNGTMAQFPRSLSNDDIYNAVSFKGKAADGTTLIGIWTLDNGPFRFDGPFGRSPYFESSDLMTTQAMVNAAAATTGARVSKLKAHQVTVTCACNYALEVGDAIRLGTPRGWLPGVVSQATYPLTPVPMTIQVDVDPLALAALT